MRTRRDRYADIAPFRDLGKKGAPRSKVCTRSHKEYPHSQVVERQVLTGLRPFFASKSSYRLSVSLLSAHASYTVVLTRHSQLLSYLLRHLTQRPNQEQTLALSFLVSERVLPGTKQTPKVQGPSSLQQLQQPADAAATAAPPRTPSGYRKSSTDDSRLPVPTRMNVQYQRPSVHDAAHQFHMPPSFGGSVSAQQQQQPPYGQQQQPQHSYAHYAPPQYAYAPMHMPAHIAHQDPQAMAHFFPGSAAGFATPFYAPPPIDAFYAQQQHQQSTQGGPTHAQAFHRGPFATPGPVHEQHFAQPASFQAAPGAPSYAQGSASRSQGRSRVPSWSERTSDELGRNVGFGQQSELPFQPQPSFQEYQHQQQQQSQQRSQWPNQADTRASLAAAAAAELDHPSFMRFPHRATNEHKPIVSSTSAHASHSIPSSSDHPVTYDLIPNISPVPPPPTLERSAVPLADLAVEMVWEAIQLGLDADMATRPASFASRFPSLFSSTSVTSSTSDSTTSSPREQQKPNFNAHARRQSRSSPHTPELYGTIGDGRAVARKISAMSFDDGLASDESSPSSTAPGTPADETAAISARRQRLAGLGLGFGFDAGAFDLKEDVATTAPQHNSSLGAASFPVEPTPAFRQFVKQVLTATLVAPEDLILALYYVARMPSSKVVPPMTQAQAGPGADAKVCALKAAPFKIFLGALTLANKTLQDNSYRNETFAAVSGIPLKDVNDLEIHVFAALGFDVAVTDEVWRPWLDIVVQRSRTHRGDLGHPLAVREALDRLVHAASTQGPAALAVGSPGGVHSPVLGGSAPSTPRSTAASQQPSPVSFKTPDTQASHASAIAAVNLDASGPLESPHRFDRQARFRTAAAPSPTRRPTYAKRFGSHGGSGGKSCAMMAAQQALFAPSSTYLRSFGIENRIR